MKPIVWIAGLILLVAFVFPNGIPLPPPPKPTPVNPEPVTPPAPVVPTDAEIVRILTPATPADKARIRSVYTGLKLVFANDTEKNIKTPEQWELLQSRTLDYALGGTGIKGKYAGLDVAIEALFDKKLGAELNRDPKEVVPTDDAVRAKIAEACDVLVASAQ